MIPLSAAQRATAKQHFAKALGALAAGLADRVCTPDGQWAIKGFVDVDRTVYSISSDTKTTSKILEIHLFPNLAAFAKAEGFDLVLTEHQNHYPDLSFVSLTDNRVKFAVDLKTTYRKPDKPTCCNGFTLGSHGEYFVNRLSTKNIRFPYASYLAHFCLGVIYDRATTAIDDTVVAALDDLPRIESVMRNMQFFVAEKWRLASDRRGSGNTANIGSIQLIEDVVAGHGMFADLGEDWFDEYWMNYGKIMAVDGQGGARPITTLAAFVAHKSGDPLLIRARRTKA